MAVVNVAEDEVEVLHHVPEVLLAVLELLGAHVPAEDVHGAVRQQLLGLEGIVELRVNLQVSQEGGWG